MRSAIALIWLSLFWTLLCFLFYRDRELIIQASLPVWIAAVAAWVIYMAVSTAVLPGRRRRGVKPRARKRAASKQPSRPGGARRAPRASTATPRKRSS
ncbi:MAG: hypothetical protein OXU75_09530 [Deltaproteobacteria bacterium]|nr:hypothetical protein [Deltaproteobacteria bacterium]